MNYTYYIDEDNDIWRFAKNRTLSNMFDSTNRAWNSNEDMKYKPQDFVSDSKAWNFREITEAEMFVEMI